MKTEINKMNHSINQLARRMKNGFLRMEDTINGI